MSDQIFSKPGLIIQFSSGEPFPTARKIFERVFHFLPNSPRLAQLEIPAGFELDPHNSLRRERVYFSQRLNNASIRTEYIIARMSGTLFNPDVPQIIITY
jgi:hypothetical protein